MTVTIRDNGLAKLIADDGMAIRRRGDDSPSTTTEAYLAPGDDASKWEDCEYEEPIERAVRTFSKLKLYVALAHAQLWDSFEAWLKTQTIGGVNAYTAFTLAQDLNDANELFNAVVESAKVALGVSDEVVQAILDAAVIDA